jgi:hypothetical protein
VFYKPKRGNKAIQLVADFFPCYVTKADRCLTSTTFADSALQAIAAIRLRQMEVTYIATKALASFGCVFHRAVCHFVDDVDFLLQHCFADTHFRSPLCVADVGVIALRGDRIDHGFLITECCAIGLSLLERLKLLTSSVCDLCAPYSRKLYCGFEALFFVCGHFCFPFSYYKNIYKFVPINSKEKKV